MIKKALVGTAVAAATIGLAACSSGSQADNASQSPTVKPSVSASKSATKQASLPGSYISLADYQANQAKYADSNVVYFFNASWCPTCQEANENLNNSKGSMPADLTVVDVDYDENSELKKQYGVTVQHTFVEVSPDGNMIKKWTGSVTPQQIESEVAG